jgi:hypothetical protein
MRSQSVGIDPVSSGAPAPIIAELEKIMDSGEAGLSHDVVKFQSMSRLNAILVVSRKPALLQTAATWIRRLDHADSVRNSVHGHAMLGLMYDKGHGMPQSFILVYKWLNLAAARSPKHERDYFLRLRNAVASKRSPMQIAEGQRLAMLWGTTRQ